MNNISNSFTNNVFSIFEVILYIYKLIIEGLFFNKCSIKYSNILQLLQKNVV